jgi:hypothetical protein
MKLHRLANLAAGTLFTVAFSLVFSLSLTVRLQAQCSDDYLKSIPPPQSSPNGVRVLQMINCTNQVLLGATNAAHQLNQPPATVFPEEKTWVMQPFDPNNWKNYSNILTIVIPKEWADTSCPVGEKNCLGVLGPNIWARTGCRYDITTNRAQCETGGCGDFYDCPSSGIGQGPYTTITEWTFYQPTSKPNIFFDNLDISAVNGTSLTVDVQPLGGDPLNPIGNGKDWGWLAYNGELGMHGGDLREAGCGAGLSLSDGGFLLKRTDIDKLGGTYFDYVIVDENGNPTCPKNEPNCDKGDNALGCLNNCGFYKFPHELGKIGCDQDDDNCLGWEVFCAGDPSLYPSASQLACTTDDQCTQYAQQHGAKYGVFASCWKNSPKETTGFCSSRAFYAEDISNCDTLQTDGHYWGAPTKDVPCSFTYQAYNDLTQMTDWSTQPPYDLCSVVKGSGGPIKCVGDDTIHKVFHGAYTWPNDPEVFADDAPVYRVIIAPGYDPGLSAPVTPADVIPLCSNLPDNYHYTQQYHGDGTGPCDFLVDQQGAVFAIANAKGLNWACSLNQRGAGDNGVMCRWKAAPGNCFPPAIDQDVTHSACGKIDNGSALVSNVPDNPGGFTPSAGDWLFAGVGIPKVLENVMPLGSSPVSGCSVNWMPVPNGSLTINSTEGLLAWYYGQVSNSQPNGCQVTVTLPTGNMNPAEVKVYDVPQFNGTFDQHSTQTGNFAGPSTYVTAGTVTTTYAPDLMLGGLLQVNQQTVPATYWDLWLTNNPKPDQPVCVDLKGQNDPHFCPTDDGADWLPGRGSNSANSDTAHKKWTDVGTYALSRPAVVTGPVDWGGLAFYIQLKK